MAGRGPAPREGAVRPNQGGKTVFSLPAEGFQGKAPALPSGHHRDTRKWYAVWTKSPQATTFIATDWQRLQQLAYVVDELHEPRTEPIYSKAGDYVGDKRVSPPVTALLAEIRQCEKLLGATVLDRASLYMTIREPLAAKSAVPTDSEAARASAERQATMHIVADTG